MHMMDENPRAVIAKAIHQFKTGKVLGIGQAKNPESLYHNPQLYPQMFPWLFPYGFGGLNNIKGVTAVSETKRKQQLLMYHDERFQLDCYFPLVAFNHEQIKNSTTGGYLLTNRKNFAQITNRILNLPMVTLENLIKCLSQGPVKPDTEEEKACFTIISDLDHVAHKVQGSSTNWKRMRNEIWALTASLGAPSWFITFAPSDISHPPALYFADTQETFHPHILHPDTRKRLIANNPVAGARFFKVMVELFLKHVLGVGLDHRGVYGDTAGYYGTVEQQGHLTLHLHMLIWIKNSLTPQEIRDRIMDPNSDFQQRMVEYLESVHLGEFLNDTMVSVSEQVKKKEEEDPCYVNPTMIMSHPAAPPCSKHGSDHMVDCESCTEHQTWIREYTDEVNNIVFKSNIHGHNEGCGFVKTGTCKARFPPQTFPHTTVDPETGALNMKKGEAWLNTYTPVLSYLLRCNTDVTSLLSGTAIKSVFAQLPPAGVSYPLYSHKVGTVVHTTHSHREQEASVGKALWHQVTTVVILHENMRQRQQTPNDAKMRKALENMQYKSCTQADIKHLQGRIAGRGAGKPKLNQPRFRNVSVITAWNAYRDKINELGCAHFARETGQQLVTFYSDDKWRSDNEGKKKQKRKTTTLDPRRSSNVIQPDIQRVLWDLPHECTDNHPGKLSLCQGMPVMIKTNEATECCVTNGAEGVVAGWTARPIDDDKMALDTLFVKLTCPPSPIKLEGLPENIIPMSHQPLKITCQMPNDKTLTILRDQVAVIPNFAMTDFGSQGQTRHDNVCDLQNCKNHQSIYTMMSMLIRKRKIQRHVLSPYPYHDTIKI